MACDHGEEVDQKSRTTTLHGFDRLINIWVIEAIHTMCILEMFSLA
ncbi:hypothetical protein [Runella sp.]